MARFWPKAAHQSYPRHLHRIAQRSGLSLSYRASRIRFRVVAAGPLRRGESLGSAQNPTPCCPPRWN